MNKCGFVSFLLLCITYAGHAQIPYFASTVGNGKIYGYTSLKVRAGIDQLESYNTVQFGLGTHFAVGADLSTNGNAAYYGFLLRYGHRFSPFFNAGVQVTPSFDLSDRFRFGYLTSALYLNGAITQDENLFWVSNTWYGINRGAKNTINQWLYLGYNIRFKKNRSLTPMAGIMYSWEFDDEPDLAVGAYYSFKKFNLYLWSDQLFRSHPRFVIGVDFTI